MAINSNQCKILCEIFRQPTSSKVEWAGVVALLNALGSDVQTKKSGISSAFPDGNIWTGHKPHPGSVLSEGAVDALRIHLLKAGETPNKNSCRCKK